MMARPMLLLAAAPLALLAAAPALAHEEAEDPAPAQTGHKMPGHKMSGHDMPSHEMKGHEMMGHDMKGHDMKGHDMAGMEHAGSSAPPSEAASAETPAAETAAPDAPPAVNDTPGNEAPPPQASDHPADRFFPADRMARARAALMKEGSFTGGALMVDMLEYRGRAGQDGYAWKAGAWYGNDIDRAVIKTEGEGDLGGKTERAEVYALWRHAAGPWFNLEAGVRHDIRPSPQRTYAVLGIEGLAPYWIEVEGQVFVSNKGDVHLRLGASHDMRLSGPLVLQPEVEVNAALQDVPELGIGGGLESLELGARLRYEIRPDFAPYVGVHWERSLSGTADRLRADGERASSVSAVVGLRAWF